MAPGQPWLDGYCVEKGVIRQFVAMPMGSGYSAEEQITDQAQHGGLQILVCPMKREVFERRFPKRERKIEAARGVRFSRRRNALDMGLAPGGRMRQEIYNDPFDFDDWDQTAASRCFVHIANSLVWRAVTGNEPPSTPATARGYARPGLPWFEYYDDSASALDCSETLAQLKSVIQLAAEKRDFPLPENKSTVPNAIVTYRRGLARDQVREGTF